eukprot:COSAG01_NODE_12208_length_1779_cov_6.427976_3_plen_57_part_01
MCVGNVGAGRRSRIGGQHHPADHLHAAHLLTDLFFFKQKTAYEILRSDWSSDVCSSD